MKKWVYLGVDQTGAIDSKGKPKPLPACVIRDSKIVFFYLAIFSKEEICKQLSLAKDEQVIVCVDCVLGLPEPLDLTWREALKRIKKYDGYGMEMARSYFFKLGKGEVLRRKIEIACHANSVFEEKPFQKNIQTGTYRIWKDISLNEKDFAAPALEKSSSKNRIRIFEGYPSLSWRLLFNSSTRVPKMLGEFMTIQFPEINWSKGNQTKVQKDPNLADALVLALTMRKWKTAGLSLKPNCEGWILGYKK